MSEIKRRNELLENPLRELNNWNFNKEEIEIITNAYEKNKGKLEKHHRLYIKGDRKNEYYIVSIKDRLEEIIICEIEITDYNEE
jgi:hypothetical protein